MVSVFTACVESQTRVKNRRAGRSRTERRVCGSAGRKDEIEVEVEVGDGVEDVWIGAREG